MNLERKFEMAIHGMNPSNKEEKKQLVKLTKDQEKAMEIALKRARERKRIEFLNKKG